MSDPFIGDFSKLHLPRTPRQKQASNEPPQEVRTMARNFWNFFCALRQEGFTEHQAIVLIAVMANPNIGGDTPG